MSNNTNNIDNSSNSNTTSPPTKTEGNFRQVLGFWPLVFFGIVSMAPTAPIVYYTDTQQWSNGYSWIGYAIATFLIVLTVLSYQIMLKKVPNSGSVYSYATYAMGPRVGFVFGWAIVLDYALTPLFVLGIVSSYLSSVFAIPYWIFVVVIGVILGCLGSVGVKTSVMSDIIIGFFLIVIVLIFLITGTHYIVSNGIPLFSKQSVYDGSVISWSGVFQSASLSLLSFCGFDAITTFSEETKLTLKKFSYTLMVAACIESFFMISTTLLAAAAQDWTTMSQSELTVAYYTLLKEWTSVGVAKVLVVGKEVCMATCILAFIVGTARILYSMGRDYVIPHKFFGHLNPKFDVPVNCAILTSIVGIVGALLLPWTFVASIVSFGACLGFIGVNISVILQCWHKEKDHKVFRHLLAPLIASIGIAYVMANQGKLCLTVGCIWTAFGIVWILLRYKYNKTFRENADAGNIHTDM